MRMDGVTQTKTSTKMSFNSTFAWDFTEPYKPCFRIVNVRAFSWKEGDNDVCVQVSCSMIDTSKHELIFVKTSPIPIEWNNSRWFSYISYVFCLGILLLPSQWTCLYSVRVVCSSFCYQLGIGKNVQMRWIYFISYCMGVQRMVT